MRYNKICICGGGDFIKVYSFFKSPISEIKFDFTRNQKYFRRLFKCKFCKHILSTHKINDQKLYYGDYSKSNYQKNILQTFLKINSLPIYKSDNYWRVKNIEKFSKNWFKDLLLTSKQKPSILDVGSGLCIFLNRVKKKLGWNCTALEIDKLLSMHSKLTLGIKTLNTDFLKMSTKKKFDIITFNKVIEHVKNPIAFIIRANELLKIKGFVYIEVPDAESAAQDKCGYQREEFTIDHPHVFSSASLSIAITKSNMKLISLQRIIEPSGKYTLRAFAARNNY